jgi:hypothetical protein
VRGRARADRIEREVMLLLYDNDSTPPIMLVSTLRTVTDLGPGPLVTQSEIKATLRRLIKSGFVTLVYYDPSIHEEIDENISPAEAYQLLEDPETWISPLERPQGRQVRATDTELGRKSFFFKSQAP